MTEPILPRNFTPSTPNSVGGLSTLFSKARHINQLNQNLKQHLPSAFSEQLHLVNIEQSIAVFACYSPAIAFRAKQQNQTILASLQVIEAFQTITEIQVKVLTK